MNIFDKLRVYVTMHNYKYNKGVDEFLKNVIKEGKLLERREFEEFTVPVRFKDKVFNVWVSNFPYADLSIIYEDYFYGPVFRYSRPSRSTQIAFWEWLERQGYDIEQHTQPREAVVQKNEYQTKCFRDHMIRKQKELNPPIGYKGTSQQSWGYCDDDDDAGVNEKQPAKSNRFALTKKEWYWLKNRQIDETPCLIAGWKWCREVCKVKCKLVPDWKDVAEFEARVAKRLVYPAQPCACKEACPLGLSGNGECSRFSRSAGWCNLKHARLEVEEEMEKESKRYV